MKYYLICRLWLHDLADHHFQRSICELVRLHRTGNYVLFRLCQRPIETPPGVSESIASCEPGDFVISGGFSYLADQNPIDQSVSSLPTVTLDGWSASMTNLSPDASIQAVAVCFDAQ